MITICKTIQVSHQLIFCASRRMSSNKTIGNGAIKLAYKSFQNTNVSSPLTPLIIIHGLFGASRNWESVANAIARTGRKVVTIDARNHGDSPRTDVMDIPSMSSDLELLLQDLCLDKAVVLGHSMGGKVAMTLALTQPQLVERLIIEDVSPVVSESARSVFPAYIKAMQKVNFDVGAESLSAMRQSVDAQLKKTFPETDVRSFILTIIEQNDDGFRWRVNLDAIEQNMDELFGFQKFDTTYNGETLFIAGALSQYIQPLFYPEILRLFPKAEIKTIEGAGHWVHAEKTHEFLKLLIGFLKQ